MSIHVDLKLCPCFRGSVYARGMCHPCYLAWWKANTTAPLVHGKRSTYAVRGCRCPLCTAAEQKYREASRA